jgi:hypothetical protein
MKESRMTWKREQGASSSSSTDDSVHDALSGMSEVVATERQLRGKLGQIMLNHGFDATMVDEWLKQHDVSELLLRPVTEREAEMKAMYAMRPLI